MHLNEEKKIKYFANTNSNRCKAYQQNIAFLIKVVSKSISDRKSYEVKIGDV